jgi:excisionase family DNA binding protein
MAEVSIKEAADRLGVSADTIRRRLKAGEVEGRRVPMGTADSKLYRWLVQLPDDLEPEPESAAAAGDTQAIELAEARVRIEGLERLIDEVASDRDHWRDQAKRSQVMAETAQRLAEGAQSLALPAGASEEARHGPQRPATMPEAAGGTAAASRPAEGLGARLRRWFLGGS